MNSFCENQLPPSSNRGWELSQLRSVLHKSTFQPVNAALLIVPTMQLFYPPPHAEWPAWCRAQSVCKLTWELILLARQRQTRGNHRSMQHGSWTSHEPERASCKRHSAHLTLHLHSKQVFTLTVIKRVTAKVLCSLKEESLIVNYKKVSVIMFSWCFSY